MSRKADSLACNGGLAVPAPLARQQVAACQEPGGSRHLPRDRRLSHIRNQEVPDTFPARKRACQGRAAPDTPCARKGKGVG